MVSDGSFIEKNYPCLEAVNRCAKGNTRFYLCSTVYMVRFVILCD